MTLTRRHFLALSAATLTARPAFASDPQVIGGQAFGSYWRGMFGSDLPAGDVSALISRVVADVDAQMSPYQPGSELSVFNRAGQAALSGDVAETTRAALQIASDTGGAFDPTVGPLVARYGFGPIEGAERAGWQALSLSGDRLTRVAEGITLDLCGIAKGHALDRMADELEIAGAGGFVLELGGEVVARGQHPEGRPWQVGIEDGAGGLAGVARFDGMAVATSGLWDQSYAVGQGRYGHLIDPITGAPAGDTLASVSVFHDRAMMADGLATALFVMGAARAAQYAQANGLATVLVARGGGVTVTGAAQSFVETGGLG
ncbi:FAD:protein FMN transferase [Nioella sp. MMSF_3534]|uniref:FAD:protein FMN transferase n=1 Tax=Nioella sp. MMSF_3534 TaxID=3046720 RepID=UPI00273FC418|nr:FAD:protein FMN transferase [Nioella sp. MMSF_3534]